MPDPEVPGVGHNAGPKLGGDLAVDAAVNKLRSLVERIERLTEERDAIASDIRDILQEAKSNGFDVKVLRQVIQLRKRSAAEVEEQELLLDTYRRALGM